MTRGLDPAITADHRRGHGDRLAEDHQIPGTDRPRVGGDQRRAPILPQAIAGRGGDVRNTDSDHARLPGQLQPGLRIRPGGIGTQAPGYASLARQRSSLAYQDI